jgi:hypothetical protein
MVLTGERWWDGSDRVVLVGWYLQGIVAWMETDVCALVNCY